MVALAVVPIGIYERNVCKDLQKIFFVACKELTRQWPKGLTALEWLTKNFVWDS